MNFAAFFRNVNLGRSGSPTLAQLEAAFAAASAAQVASFQVNGTIAFQARSLRAAQAVLAVACDELHRVCGLTQPGCVRALEALAALPAATVFGDVDPGSVHEFTVSFACGKLAQSFDLPLRNARGDAEIRWLDGGTALGISRKLMSGPGSPNRLLEQLTGLPFTSRSLGTIERLVAKHG